jgi:threonine/homoserine/homoserine lactone efflux protein
MSMLKLVRIFIAGLFIAFIGMLPLGTQNMAAMQIAITDGMQPAILFALGMVIPDVFYVQVTLLAMQWIQKQQKLFKALESITLIIVLSLAMANFYAALHPTVEKNVLLSNRVPRFLLGIILNGVNPMQIPFWFGWSTILFTKKILEPSWKAVQYLYGRRSHWYVCRYTGIYSRRQAYCRQDQQQPGCFVFNSRSHFYHYSPGTDLEDGTEKRRRASDKASRKNYGRSPKYNFGRR